jgi:hypothetical protein
MAKLEARIQVYIVHRLACFCTPTEIVDLVKEEFGVEIVRQQVRNYNPEQVRVADKWVKLHAETRKQFVEETARIGIANQSYRLLRLQRIAELAGKAKNLMVEAQALEQAAKEVGGYYTNKREVKGSLTLDQALLALASEDHEGT